MATKSPTFYKRPKEEITPHGLSHEQNIEFINRLLASHPVVWPCYCGQKKYIRSNVLRNVMSGLADEGYDGILILFDNIKDDWNTAYNELSGGISENISAEREELFHTDDLTTE